MSQRVRIHENDCDLTLTVNDGATLTPLTEDGFCWLWSGARANVSLSAGKYYYEAKIVENLTVSSKNLEVHPGDVHFARFGWSSENSIFSDLGNSFNSFGFGSTAKAIHNKNDYGCSFGIGDIVGCYVDFDQRSMSFSVNGKLFRTAFKFNLKEDEGLIPHILIKNVRVEINFGQYPAWSPYKKADFKFVEEFDESDGYLCEGLEDPLELVLLVGLPFSGKTTWATKKVSQSPSMYYHLLSVNYLMGRMKVPGLGKSYQDRMNILVDEASDCFRKLIEIAATKRGNYIIGLPNISCEERIHILERFDQKWTKKAATEKLHRRKEIAQATEGKYLPFPTIMYMYAAFTPPTLEEGFDAILFIKEPEIAAIRISEYNLEGNEFFQKRQLEKQIHEVNFARFVWVYEIEYEDTSLHPTHSQSPKSHSSNFRQPSSGWKSPLKTIRSSEDDSASGFYDLNLEYTDFNPDEFLIALGDAANAYHPISSNKALAGALSTTSPQLSRSRSSGNPEPSPRRRKEDLRREVHRAFSFEELSFLTSDFDEYDERDSYDDGRESNNSSEDRTERGDKRRSHNGWNRDKDRDSDRIRDSRQQHDREKDRDYNTYSKNIEERDGYRSNRRRSDYNRDRQSADDRSHHREDNSHKERYRRDNGDRYSVETTQHRERGPDKKKRLDSTSPVITPSSTTSTTRMMCKKRKRSTDNEEAEQLGNIDRSTRGETDERLVEVNTEANAIHLSVGDPGKQNRENSNVTTRATEDAENRTDITEPAISNKTSKTESQTTILVEANAGNDKTDLLSSSDSTIAVPSFHAEGLIPSTSNIQDGFIAWQDLDLVSSLGEGAFGYVWLALWGAEKVAVKRLLVSEGKRLTLFLQEMQMMHSLDHPNIVKVLGSTQKYEDSPFHFMVMEYVPKLLRNVIRGESLETRLKLWKPVCIGIAKGIHYLHENGIIHRDLKPSNILLTVDNIPKITDFGVSTYSDKTSCKTQIGTPTYMAPEMLQVLPYGSRVDIYSYGMIIWQIISGQRPLANEGIAGGELGAIQFALKIVVQNLRPTIPEICPANVKQLITRCWDRDSTNRPTIPEILEVLEQFSGNEWNLARI